MHSLRQQELAWRLKSIRATLSKNINVKSQIGMHNIIWQYPLRSIYFYILYYENIIRITCSMYLVDYRLVARFCCFGLIFDCYCNGICCLQTTVMDGGTRGQEGMRDPPRHRPFFETLV